MAEWGAEYSHGGLLQNIDPSQVGNFKQVTSSATANTLGSWVDLTTNLARSCQGFLVSYASSSSNLSCLMDVGVDTSGGTSYTVIAEQIAWFGHQLRTTEWFYVPIAVPAGSRVAARHQCSTGSTDLRLCFHPVYAGPWSRPAVGSKVVAFGASTADSGGTQVDGAVGGVANTYSGTQWTLSASTGYDICAVCVKVGGIVNTAPANGSFAFRISSSQVIHNGFRFASGSTGDNYGPLPSMWLPMTLPAGSALTVNAMSSVIDATDRLFDLVAYGLVK